MDNIKLNIETNAEIAIQVLTFYRSLKDHPQHPQYYLHDQMRVQNSPRKRGPGRPPKKGTNVPKFIESFDDDICVCRHPRDLHEKMTDECICCQTDKPEPLDALGRSGEGQSILKPTKRIPRIRDPLNVGNILLKEAERIVNRLLTQTVITEDDRIAMVQWRKELEDYIIQ